MHATCMAALVHEMNSYNYRALAFSCNGFVIVLCVMVLCNGFVLVLPLQRYGASYYFVTVMYETNTAACARARTWN